MDGSMKTHEEINREGEIIALLMASEIFAAGGDPFKNKVLKSVLNKYGITE